MLRVCTARECQWMSQKLLFGLFLATCKRIAFSTMLYVMQRESSTLNLWNPVCPAYEFLWKKLRLSSYPVQKLDARGDRALLETNPMQLLNFCNNNHKKVFKSLCNFHCWTNFLIMKVIIIFCLTFSYPNCSFQQDFIRRCLAENPAERPTARDLLLHPSLFEVLI